MRTELSRLTSLGACLFLLAGARAQPISLRDYAPADPADWAPAFVAAYNAAVARGGGEIVIPQGRYPLAGSPQGDDTAHLVISSSHVTFVGAGRRTRNPAPAERGQGTYIYSTTPNKTVFRIAPPNAAVTVRGTVFRDLKIGRECKEPVVEGASGILFDNNHAKENTAVFIWDTTLDHVSVWNHYDGVRATKTARAHGLEFVGCRFSENARSGTFLDRWGGIHAVATTWTRNGGDGLTLDNYPSTSAAGYCGTANLNDCEFFGNKGNGMRIDNHWTGPAAGTHNPADFHITSCQFDANFLSGLVAVDARNINIAGCSFTASSQACQGDASASDCATDGIRLERCATVSISGTSIMGGRSGGLSLIECSHLSAGNCSVIWNNNRENGGRYAVSVIGGSDLTLTGFTLSGAPQTLGVWLEKSPQNLLITAFNFGSGMKELFAYPDGDAGIKNATGHVQYWRPEGDYKGIGRSPAQMMERPLNSPR